MDLLLYVVASGVYLMIMHFTFAVNENQFGRFFMAAFFVLGGILGWHLESYATGWIVAVVLSLFFL